MALKIRKSRKSKRGYKARNESLSAVYRRIRRERGGKEQKIRG